MKCDDPIKVLDAGVRSKSGKVYLHDVEVRCGRCYPCRIHRLRGWIFRLRQEAKNHDNRYFVTLTYDPVHVPITPNGFMTLKKEDVKRYMKDLRNTYRYKQKGKYYYDKVPKIKYYFVGEYGSKGHRPHYHAILFGADEDNIVNAWDKGNVQIGTVTEASVAYTLTYLIVKSSLDKKHARDDRIKEFQLMSKGLGEGYITDEVIKSYKKDIYKMHILQEDGTKIGIPKFYRDKIFSDKEKSKQAHKAQAIEELNNKRDRRTDEQKRNAKVARLNKFRKIKK